MISDDKLTEKLLDGNLRCAVAVFLEAGILVLIFLVAIVEFVDDGMAQDALAFAVNEDYLLPRMALILLQCLAENIELILKDVTARHAGSGVEEFVGMQVDDYLVVAHYLLHLVRLALRAIVTADEGLYGLRSPTLYSCHRLFATRSTCRFLVAGLKFWPGGGVHLALKSFGIDNQRTCGAVVFDNREEQGIVVEEVVRREGVELAKLYGVDAELHVDCRF